MIFNIFLITITVILILGTIKLFLWWKNYGIKFYRIFKGLNEVNNKEIELLKDKVSKLQKTMKEHKKNVDNIKL